MEAHGEGAVRVSRALRASLLAGSSPKATLSLIASGNEEGEQDRLAQETEKERGGGLSLRIECFYGSCLRWEGLTLL